MRRGQSQRQVARAFKVSLRAVQYWLKRAQGKALADVEWSDRSSRPHDCPRRISPVLERQVVTIRQALQTSPLGFVGAASIAQTLAPVAGSALPSLRTIGRILQRQGLLDGRRRLRRSPPPPGWYLPLVAAQNAALDAFDFIEDLCLDGGRWLHVLTTRALAGSLCAAWPNPDEGTTAKVLATLPLHWQRHGRPGFAQFDNDLRFLGPSRYPDTLGQVVSLCLQLQVTPVFAPPAEHGLQNLVESFNALWQTKVWHRFEHQHLTEVCHRSEQFVTALQQRWAARNEKAPLRQPFPQNWRFDRRWPLEGVVIFIRRTDLQGRLSLLGHQWNLDPGWCGRLVRAEVDLTVQQIRCYRLRRQAHADQPLIKIIPYHFPQKRRTLP